MEVIFTLWQTTIKLTLSLIPEFKISVDLSLVVYCRFSLTTIIGKESANVLRWTYKF
jgi:hypothetical protein